MIKYIILTLCIERAAVNRKHLLGLRCCRPIQTIWIFSSDIQHHLRFLATALCYCTAVRATVVTRASVVVVFIVFSDTTEWINTKFWGQVPIHHISRTFFFFLFFKILIFLCFMIFLLLLFSLTWDHMGEKISNDISSETTHQVCSLKFLYTPGEGL